MHDFTIKEKILSKNDELAGENRVLLRERGVYSINMVSSPGSGKTSVIEKTLEALKGKLEVAVIEGDLQTDLDAHLVGHALDWLFSHPEVRLLIIENVGNMVCPAEYDLGEDAKVVVMSAPEGDDKPLKYPAIFHASDVLLINKTDLIPHTDFSMARARKNALAINPGLKIFETSCVTGEGIDAWVNYLTGEMMTVVP